MRAHHLNVPRAIRRLLAATVALVAMTAVAASAAQAVPATWAWYYSGDTSTSSYVVHADPLDPLVVRVGSNPAVSCSAVSTSSSTGSNVGSPLQAQVQATVRFGCQPNGVNKLEIDFTGLGTKDGAVKTLSANASHFRVIDSVGIWDVDNVQFAGPQGQPSFFYGGSTVYRRVNIPLTTVGTTTVGGHAVTLRGGLIVPGALQ